MKIIIRQHLNGGLIYFKMHLLKSRILLKFQMLAKVLNVAILNII